MRAAAAIAVMAGLLGLGGCISTSAEAPQWFTDRLAEEEGGYPSLRDVPRTSVANTDQQHWSQLEQDLQAAGAELKSHPRAAPASEADVQPSEFLEQAREDLEEARQAHPD